MSPDSENIDLESVYSDFCSNVDDKTKVICKDLTPMMICSLQMSWYRMLFCFEECLTVGLWPVILVVKPCPNP